MRGSRSVHSEYLHKIIAEYFSVLRAPLLLLSKIPLRGVKIYKLKNIRRKHINSYKYKVKI